MTIRPQSSHHKTMSNFQSSVDPLSVVTIKSVEFNQVNTVHYYTVKSVLGKDTSTPCNSVA